MNRWESKIKWQKKNRKKKKSRELHSALLWLTKQNEKFAFDFVCSTRRLCVSTGDQFFLTFFCLSLCVTAFFNKTFSVSNKLNWMCVCRWQSKNGKKSKSLNFFFMLVHSLFFLLLSLSLAYSDVFVCWQISKSVCGIGQKSFFTLRSSKTNNAFKLLKWKTVRNESKRRRERRKNCSNASFNKFNRKSLTSNLFNKFSHLAFVIECEAAHTPKKKPKTRESNCQHTVEWHQLMFFYFLFLRLIIQSLEQSAHITTIELKSHEHSRAMFTWQHKHAHTHGRRTAQATEKCKREIIFNKWEL